MTIQFGVSIPQGWTMDMVEIADPDVMSHGRFILGFGAGWYEHEYRAYGYGYPDTRERMARFREATEIIHRMWTEDYPTFDGQYYHIDKPINEPKGVQKPHPPLWLAGSGEKVTLKLVAQWGDGCNVDIKNVRRKLDVLRQHCEKLNRDFNEITRSVSMTTFVVESEATAEAETTLARKGETFEQFSQHCKVGTAAQIIAHIETSIAEGVNYLIFYLPRTAYDLTQMQRVASEIISHFRRS